MIARAQPDSAHAAGASSLPNPLGGERRSFYWRGYRIAYVVRGAGKPVLFVHSIHAAAWNAEWRFIVPTVSERYTTYSLDLIGFGASDRPDIDYTALLLIDLVRDFAREVIGAPAIVVGSSLGGTYAIAMAHDEPALVRAVCAVGPAGVTRLAEPGGSAGKVVQKLFGTGAGGALFAFFVSRPMIGVFLRKVYSSTHAMPADSTELFWRAAREPGARFAPAAFVAMRLNHDLRGILPRLQQPFLLLWGESAGQSPIAEAPPMLALAKTATFVRLPGGDLPHEERPAEFNRALLAFLDGLA